MKDKGEFKKRVQSRIDKQKSESKCSDAVENLYVHQVYIDSLVDEVAKGFYALLIEWKKNKETSNYCPVCGHPNQIEDCMKLIKKWFPFSKP